MKKRRFIKTRELPSKIDKKDELIKKTTKAVQQVNQRIKSIERKFKDNGNWSITKIKNRLSKYFKSGKLKIPKNAKEIELIDILKESTNMLESKAGTKKGIREIKERAKSSLLETLSTEDIDVTKEDINDYYSMFEDDNYNSFIKMTGLTASEVFAIIDDAIRAGDSESSFIKRLETFVNIVDEDIRNKAIRLYNKYVR